MVRVWRERGGHSEAMGWKPGAWDRLERALLGGEAGGDSLGQVAPTVDLLHGSDEDALADGQQVELGKEEFGGAAQAVGHGDGPALTLAAGYQPWIPASGFAGEPRLAKPGPSAIQDCPP